MSEDLKIPVLVNEEGRLEEEEGFSPEEKKRANEFITSAFKVFFFAMCLLGIVVVYHTLDVQINMTLDNPEILVDSVYVCPIHTPNKTDIWDLRFDITNSNKDTSLCIDQFEQFEASVFSSSYNRSSSSSQLLLAKASVDQTCVAPISHTSFNTIFKGEVLLQDDDSDQGNGTIRVDLNFHGRFIFKYRGADFYKTGDVICRDAKLAFFTSSSSSCRTMITDPLCSYQFSNYY